LPTVPTASAPKRQRLRDLTRRGWYRAAIEKQGNNGHELPDGRIEIKASRPTGKISDVFDFLKRENGPSFSIEEINEVASGGWAGRR
jgi:hypothetical protein